MANVKCIYVCTQHTHIIEYEKLQIPSLSLFLYGYRLVKSQHTTTNNMGHIFAFCMHINIFMLGDTIKAEMHIRLRIHSTCNRNEKKKTEMKKHTFELCTINSDYIAQTNRTPYQLFYIKYHHNHNHFRYVCLLN